MNTRSFIGNNDFDFNRTRDGQDRLISDTEEFQREIDAQNQERYRYRFNPHADDLTFSSSRNQYENPSGHGYSQNRPQGQNFLNENIYPEENFEFYDNADYGPHYVQKNHHPGMMESMKKSVKNFFGKGPKGYRRSDERIHEDVCEMLYRHPHIDASEIEVTVKDGIVTLQGRAESRSIKRLIEDEVENCAGVRDIHNQIRISDSPEIGNSLMPTPARRGKSKSMI